MRCDDAAMSDVPEIDVTSAAQRAGNGGFLLDVREENEWQAGHAPQATLVPLTRFEAEYAERVPRDRPILAICKTGARSGRVTAALLNAGYDVVNVAGGMKAWEAEGLPVVADDGSPGAVI
jgi:rhodanese-related sulfurtransferase